MVCFARRPEPPGWCVRRASDVTMSRHRLERDHGMTGPDGTSNGVRVVLEDDHAPFRRNVAEMLSLV